MSPNTCTWLGAPARSAAWVIARASTASKNAALLEIAATIEKREAHILEENAAGDVTPRRPISPWR